MTLSSVHLVGAPLPHIFQSSELPGAVDALCGVRCPVWSDTSRNPKRMALFVTSWYKLAPTEESWSHVCVALCQQTHKLSVVRLLLGLQDDACVLQPCL